MNDLKMMMFIFSLLTRNTYFEKLSKNCRFNPLNANPTKWPNTLKQFVGKLPTNCLSVFGHFVNLTLKGLSLQEGLEYIDRENPEQPRY